MEGLWGSEKSLGEIKTYRTLSSSKKIYITKVRWYNESTNQNNEGVVIAGLRAEGLWIDTLEKFSKDPMKEIKKSLSGALPDVIGIIIFFSELTEDGEGKVLTSVIHSEIPDMFSLNETGLEFPSFGITVEDYLEKILNTKLDSASLPLGPENLREVQKPLLIVL